jgi:hypothetical protein
MELHVEDEEGIARPVLERPGSAASTGSTSKKAPKTAFMARSDVAMPPLRRRKIPPAQPEPRREPAGLGEDSFLDGTLGGRLGQGRELLVGYEPRGNGISER